MVRILDTPPDGCKPAAEGCDPLPMGAMRHLPLALGALCIAALACGAAPATALSAPLPAPLSAPGDWITLDSPEVSPAADGQSGPVTYSGSYRCLPSSAEGHPVEVSPALENDHESVGLSGSPAVCDGAVHPWSTTVDSAPADDLHPTVHLYRLDSASLGWLTVPVPTELAHAG